MKYLFLLIIGCLLFTAGIVFAQIKSFPDVTSSDWFYNDVMNMVEWDVIRGNADGTFKPSNNVNRAELSAMWNRYDKRVQGLIAGAGSTNQSAYITALEARVKKLEDQINTTTAPMTQREMILYNGALNYANKIGDMGYEYTNNSFKSILDVIKNLHTGYTFTNTPTTPTVDCQAIRDSYSFQGFGRSSAMEDALKAAGCPVN
jgi:hypothetical protein